MASLTRTALIQLCATNQVSSNLKCAEDLIDSAAAAGAEVVALPEAFAFIGPDAQKRRILEPLDDPQAQTPILDWCRNTARRHQIDLIVGGFHEASEDPARSYNTCLHVNPQGDLAARYRKIHLFDVELADGTVLQESSRTLPGDVLATSELAFGTLGLSICYDLRFPYLYQQLVDLGATVLTVPSAFTATTGAAHWHTLLRARAIETQCYVLAPAQHGQHNDQRRSYGHSMVINPWGEVIAELDDGDGFVIAEIDPSVVQEIRNQLPSLKHRRTIE
jgi:predicted amidohydrolase